MEFKYNMFLSFKRSDEKSVEYFKQIYQNIIQSGFKVFLDEKCKEELIGND